VQRLCNPTVVARTRLGSAVSGKFQARAVLDHDGPHLAARSGSDLLVLRCLVGIQHLLELPPLTSGMICTNSTTTMAIPRLQCRSRCRRDPECTGAGEATLYNRDPILKPDLALAVLSHEGQGGGSAGRRAVPQKPCQKFARSCARRSLASPHDLPLSRVSGLGNCVITCGAAGRCELPAHRW
jgi:hypothetical protein